MSQSSVPIPAELQKVNTFTQAAFLGSKNLHQKCVIHDKINPTKKCVIRDKFNTKGLENSVKDQETL